MYGLKTEAFFDSAHFLHEYEGKCENLHGHRWRLVAILGGARLKKEGDERDMVCDFAHFKREVRALADAFDHTFLIEQGSLAPSTIQALESESFRLTIVPFRTTAENLARYFYDQLTERGFPVVATEVYETPMNCAIYTCDEAKFSKKKKKKNKASKKSKLSAQKQTHKEKKSSKHKHVKGSK